MAATQMPNGSESKYLRAKASTPAASSFVNEEQNSTLDEMLELVKTTHSSLQATASLSLGFAKGDD